MDQVLEVSQDQVEAVEEQQVVELPTDLFDQVGGGVAVTTL